MQLDHKTATVMGYTGIDVEEIPELELYMDQVMQFMKGRLAGLRADESDRLITKTMINNYVKAGIIEKPERKRYRPDQLMALIMVFHLKNVASMNDIDHLLQAARASGEPQSEGGRSMEDVYRDFLATWRRIRAEKEQTLALEDLDEDEKLAKAMDLLLEADLNKRLAESLLQTLPRRETGGKGKTGSGKGEHRHGTK